MNVINLTPHTINVRTESGWFESFPPSGLVARVATTMQAVDLDLYPPAVRSLAAGFGKHEAGEMVIRSSTFGAVTGLPESAEDTVYLVSALVRAAVPHRLDVLSPGELIRNESGQPVGCDGFIAN